MTARVCRFEERADFDEMVEDTRGDLEVVHSDLVEQLAFNSWLLFCRSEVLSIAPANATGSSITTEDICPLYRPRLRDQIR